MQDFIQQINPQGGIKHLSNTGNPENSAIGYVGNHYRDTLTGDIYYKAFGDNTNTGWTWINSTGGNATNLLPTGTIVMTIAESVTGALKFDGVSSYPKSGDYATLYSQIQTALLDFGGTGNEFDVDNDNFYLPDPTGRVLGVAGAGRMLFDLVGSDTHILLIEEIPSHTHHQNGYGGSDIKSGNSSSSDVAVFNGDGKPSARSDLPYTDATGGGQAHSIVQKTGYFAKNLFIYY